MTLKGVVEELGLARELKLGKALSTPHHLVEGITKGGAAAVLAASIFHYGEFTVGEAKAAMAAAGIEIRSVV